MAGNHPQNLDPFREPSQFHFQGSQTCHKRKFHQHSADSHQEFKRPRFPETTSNPSSRMSNSSSSSQWKQPLRRYDEPCQRFRKGRCEYGERCIYSHEEGPVVYPFQGGVTRLDGRLCRYMAAGRICPYGKSCTFSHQGFRGSSSDEPRESSVVLVKRVDQDARMYRKTKICQKWQDYGSCPLGPRCHFAHGLNDLRQLPPSSQREGSGMLPKVETAKLEPENAAPAKKTVMISIAAAAKKAAASSSSPAMNPHRPALFNRKINGIYGDWI